jgi:hypothetical protein
LAMGLAIPATIRSAPEQPRVIARARAAQGPSGKDALGHGGTGDGGHICSTHGEIPLLMGCDLAYICVMSRIYNLALHSRQIETRRVSL